MSQPLNQKPRKNIRGEPIPSPRSAWAAAALAKREIAKLVMLSLGMLRSRQQRTKLNRLYTPRPEDAEWRSAQAQIDADIEGLSRSSELASFVSEMKKSGIPVDERIKRLKAHVVARQYGRKPTAP